MYYLLECAIIEGLRTKSGLYNPQIEDGKFPEIYQIKIVHTVKERCKFFKNMNHQQLLIRVFPDW